MALRFAKVVPHARPPERLNEGDPGLSVFSAENFKVEYSEVHSYRTGIVLEIPEGSVGMLVENAGMGVKGVTVAGPLLTSNDIGEVRVNLINSHREAFEVRAGDPICFLLLLKDPSEDDEVEEYDLEGLSNEMKEAAEEVLVATRKARAEKAAKEAGEAVPK